MRRARKRAVEQQKPRQARRRSAGGVQPSIRVISGCRTQKRIPLADIDRRSDIGRSWEQKMVFDVEQARRLVGPLDVPANLVEVPALVAKERPFRDPGMRLTGLFYSRKQCRQVAGREIDLIQRGET